MYVFHSDAGHGWLAVKRHELERLGILKRISHCSYEKGDTVYLEEDCDAPLFIKTKEDSNEPFEYRESCRETSPVRSYPHFSL